MRVLLSLDGTSFDVLCVCSILNLSVHMHTVPTVLPQSLCVWSRKSLHLLEEGKNHPIVHFTYFCHMISKESSFLSSV